MPGPSGSRKSYSQTRSLAQRPLPAGTGPWQAIATGSGRRGSPNGTTACRELDHHLAHLRDLALRRRGDDGDGCAASTVENASDGRRQRAHETLFITPPPLWWRESKSGLCARREVGVRGCAKN